MAQATQTHIRQLIYALSDALDLVGVDDLAHGKRVGIMAAEVARVAGAGGDRTGRLFELGLLHDIGVSSTVTHGHLVNEFDWGRAQDHCRVGHALLQDFRPLAWMAEPILYHHTHWQRLSTLGLPEPEALAANLVFLVDRVDALSAPHYADGSLLMHAADIRQQIADYCGNFFAPSLVEQFMAASQPEAFWLSLEPRSIQVYMQDMLREAQPTCLSMAELKQLARIFSRIVDAKSPFTAEHSQGVASLARFLAERLGVAAENCDRLEIAGLLHDIGKLRVPDEILDKPASLDDRERKMMNAHSFETFQILRKIPGFEDITLWAAYHHESPGGRGYPFHVPAETLPLEARILRFADIFQAMVQDRPYRPGLGAGAVTAFMADLCDRGEIEAELLAVATADLPATMAAALPLSRATGLA